MDNLGNRGCVSNLRIEKKECIINILGSEDLTVTDVLISLFGLIMDLSKQRGVNPDALYQELRSLEKSGSITINDNSEQSN